MAEIYPFRALHYNLAAVGDLSKVTTQPYDKISPEMQARYYEAHPANLVRLILRRRGVTGNVYLEAAQTFQNWISDRTLISEPEPCLYPYTQDYEVPGRPGERRRRWGFIALLRLADYSQGVVHRHEETLSGPKADRLELLKATRANFGHIFMLYSDPAGEAEKALRQATAMPSWQQVTDEFGTVHRLGRVGDPAAIERVVEIMHGKKLVIADGHHRYETSLTYAQQRKLEAPQDDLAGYVMATFVPLESEGLLILPTHRVVHSLDHFDWNRFATATGAFFEWTPLEFDDLGAVEASKLQTILETSGREGPSFIAFAGEDRFALLSLRHHADLSPWLSDLPAGLRSLDAVLLHRLVLENLLGIDRQAVREQKNLRYVREIELAMEEVRRRRAQICFLMNPTPVTAVWENALAGHVLPQKSTDFYPKLLSGLTLYWMDNPSGM
jgi:uncharacterized protein (DUF1015 family)